MKRKQISLIEIDVDGVEVVVAAPNEELLNKDATSLWETFCAYPNKGFSEPTAPSFTEFNDEGGVDCIITVSYPMKVTREIVEDWLSENAKISEKDSKDDSYFYW